MPALALAFGPIAFAFAVLAAIHDRRRFVQNAAANIIAAHPLARVWIFFELFVLAHVGVERFDSIAHAGWCSTGALRAGSLAGNTSATNSRCFHSGTGVAVFARGTNFERATSLRVWM